MDILRNMFDAWYLKNRDRLFADTEEDPEEAHKWLVREANKLHQRPRLERLLLDNSANRVRAPFELSNAAGFNKNGELPPSFLHYLGFDRVAVGTVTADEWDGNPFPRIKRYPTTRSMVNWMGLPGLGAEAVAEILRGYGNHGVNLTINLMSTPGKQGDAVLRDLEQTCYHLRDVIGVDRFELNISCPNTHSSGGGMDARAEYLQRLNEMLATMHSAMHKGQRLYLKVSPDLSEADAESIIELSRSYGVEGFTTTNTTTVHDPRYITSPPNAQGKGGASGDAVYDKSFFVQHLFSRLLDQQKPYNCARLIACGGISTISRVGARITDSSRVSGIQLFTPLIFNGPGFIRKIREAYGRPIPPKR